MQRGPISAKAPEDTGEAFFAARGLPIRHDRPAFSAQDWPVVVPRGVLDRTPNGRWVRFIALRSMPLFYHPIEKSGCTFLKNLMWMIEWGEPYAAGPLDIHDNYDMAFDRVYVDPQQGMPQEGVFFTCAREPVSRFLSVYFDKFISQISEFDHVRRIAANGFGFDPNPPETAAAHRKNLVCCLRFVRAQIAFNQRLFQDGHYLPQARRLRAVKRLGGEIVLLESIEQHLRFVLADRVPELPGILSQLRDATHHVPRPFTIEELVDPELQAEIYDLYRVDRNIYQDLVRRWRRRLRLAADGSRSPLYG